jgi:trk system potassium uptake protein TrkA
VARELEIGIIGLGKFGLNLGKTLVELGHNVLGLDSDPDNIRRAQSALTKVYQLDARDKRALAQVNIQSVHHVAVSVGHSMDASILISLYLKEMGVPNIWVKAISEDHEKILRHIGVDEVIFPEKYAAIQMAHRLARPGLIEQLPFGRDVVMWELTVKDWAGQNLRQLALPARAGAQVLAVRHEPEGQYDFVPKADQPLKAGDRLVLLGRETSLAALKP